MALAFAAGALFSRRPSMALVGALAGAVALASRRRGNDAKPVKAPRTTEDPPVTATVTPACVPTIESGGEADGWGMDGDGLGEALDPLPEVPGDASALPGDSKSAPGNLAGLTLPELGSCASVEAAPGDARTADPSRLGDPGVESGAGLASPSIASSGGSGQAQRHDQAVRSVIQEKAGARVTIKALPGTAVVEAAQKMGTEIIPRPALPQSGPDAASSAEEGGTEMRFSKSSPSPSEIPGMAPTPRTSAPSKRNWMRWWP